jgi:bifunctional DNA primase/polymerase-like protein
MSSQTQLRQRLRSAGYAPIPCEGKRPRMEKWQTKKDTTAEEIAQWEKLWPTARNTGILTQHTPALDIDILNQEAAKGVEELARERFGERGCFLVRIGLAPKRIVLLRTDKPFEKISANLIAPNGDTKQKIEILADGQQAIVFGTHPETRNPYSWHGGQPGEIACEELPHVSEHEARQFVADAVALLVEPFGYREAASRPKKNGNGLEHADADWAYLVSNIRQGRELHDTLRDLAAKLVTSGMTEGAAINFLRALMHECEAPHDARWRERYDDIARVVEGT